MSRILEEDLQLPALYLISLNNGLITTSELSNLLRSLLNPKGEDLDILDGRTDDKFSQIVRNLTGTERPFVKNGFISRESGRNKPLFITEKGRTLLQNKQNFIKYLFTNDFDIHDIINGFRSINHADNRDKKIEFVDENLTISEGKEKIIETKSYQRSNKLRNIAIEHYTQKGRIKCKACCFDFESFYGEHGRGFIEIHHQKPVFMFGEDEFKKTIESALQNVIPVCANCHRMIHRKTTSQLTLQELKNLINHNLYFCD